jgi:hypothetical protein
MHQQLWGYKVEKKLYLGVCEQKRLNTTIFNSSSAFSVSRKQGHIRTSDFMGKAVLTTEHSSAGGNIYLARFSVVPVYVLNDNHL